MEKINHVSFVVKKKILNAYIGDNGENIAFVVAIVFRAAHWRIPQKKHGKNGIKGAVINEPQFI